MHDDGIFFLLRSPAEECESRTHQRTYRTKGPIATWQLGLKRASSRSLSHSACCPTSVMARFACLRFHLCPLNSPPSFELSKRNSLELLRKGRKKGGKFLPLFGNQSFRTIKKRIRDFFFLLFLSLSLLNLKRNTTDRSCNFNNNSLGKTFVRKV